MELECAHQLEAPCSVIPTFYVSGNVMAGYSKDMGKQVFNQIQISSVLLHDKLVIFLNFVLLEY